MLYNNHKFFWGGIMENNFKIEHGHNGVIIEKNGAKFSVEQSPDGDIWFNSIHGNTELKMYFYSRNIDECNSTSIFAELIDKLVDKYICSGDFADPILYGFNLLPNDFIDINSRTITWHSDSDLNNTLQLRITDYSIIVSITTNKNEQKRNYSNTIKVRIRTSGSDYGTYYQEFIEFYNELYKLAYQIESTQNLTASKNKTQKAKKLSKIK